MATYLRGIGGTETYIQKWGPPKFVVVIHTNEMWRYDYNLTAWSQIRVNFKQWSQFDPQPVKGFLNFLKMAVRKYFPLYSENQTLRDLILNPKQFFAERRPFPIGADGYTPVTKHYGEDFTDKAIGSHLQSLKDILIHVSNIFRRRLRLKRRITIVSTMYFIRQLWCTPSNWPLP